MKSFSLKTLIYNIYSLCTYSFKEDREKISRLEKGYSYAHTLLYYANDEEVREELEYVRRHGIMPFPYKQVKQLEEVEYGMDGEKKLPYVVHEGKRLYFPKQYTALRALDTYRNFIENENILGGGYKEKAPHQYQTEEFRVEEGDVLVDVGCAEGLLALDTIEKVKKVYLIEAEKEWIPALEATFEPWKEKVVVVNKMVANEENKGTIRLSGIVAKEKGERLFVKMDIEGYETEVLKEILPTLKVQNDVKLACCTYHKADDERVIKELMDEAGYEWEMSEGYMLFMLDDQTAPFFRKGLIRARKR